VCAALLLLGACSSDSDDDPAASEGTQDTAADDGATDDGATDEQAGDDGAGDDGATGDLGDAPGDLPDGLYTQGEAHVDVSGDFDETIDYEIGSGSTGEGSTSLSFSDGSSGVLGLLIQGAGGGVSWSTTDGRAAGGEFGRNCEIGLTESSASELAGSFRCEDVPGIDVATEATVTLEGTFSVTA
jgi:hypothetical protein